MEIRGKGTDQISRIDLAKGKTALGRDKKSPYQLTLSAKEIGKGITRLACW